MEILCQDFFFPGILQGFFDVGGIGSTTIVRILEESGKNLERIWKESGKNLERIWKESGKNLERSLGES